MPALPPSAVPSPAFEMVLECLAKALLGLMRDTVSASELIIPAVSPAQGRTQFMSWALTLNGLVQMLLWSRARLRRNSTGWSLAKCRSSSTLETGAGFWSGEEGACVESDACPQEQTVIAQNKNMKPILLRRFELTSFPFRVRTS